MGTDRSIHPHIHSPLGLASTLTHLITHLITHPPTHSFTHTPIHPLTHTSKYNPDKLKEVDTLLVKYRGKEASLISAGDCARVTV